jgi:hypothetical protein
VILTARRRLPAPSFLSLLVLAALAVGCGGGPDDQPVPAGPPLDACALFTFDDARAVAGETIAPMASTFDEAKGRDPGECIYNSGRLDQPRVLSLLIRTHRSVARAKRLQESSRSTLGAMSRGKVQDVPGLGDGAFWVGGQLQQLHMRKGHRQFIIKVDSPDGTDQLPRARQIAVKVLERLKTTKA